MNSKPIERGGKAHQQGLSLVELMVAVVLGLVLTAGIIQLFLGSKHTYRFHDAQSRLQENARFAIEALNYDVRMAGNMGCTANFQREAPGGTGELAPGFFRVALNNANNYQWDFGNGLQGHHWNGSGWTPALPAGLAVLDGSDVLTLRGAESAPIVVTNHPGGTPPGSAALGVNTANGLNPGDILVVSDCTSAAVFQVSAGNPNTSGLIPHNTGGGAPGNFTNALGRDFTGSEVMRVSTRSYFIATGADGSPSLFRSRNLGAPEELVNGVERMRVDYGVDDNGNRIVDQYMTGDLVDAAGRWGNVISVRISLLMQSGASNITDAIQPIQYDGGLITPADRRLRQVYNTTVTVRNRSL